MSHRNNMANEFKIGKLTVKLHNNDSNKRRFYDRDNSNYKRDNRDSEGMYSSVLKREKHSFSSKYDKEKVKNRTRSRSYSKKKHSNHNSSRSISKKDDRREEHHYHKTRHHSHEKKDKEKTYSKRGNSHSSSHSHADKRFKPFQYHHFNNHFQNNPNFPNLSTTPYIDNSYNPLRNISTTTMPENEPSNTLLVRDLGPDITKDIIEDIFREKCIMFHTSMPDDIIQVPELRIAYVVFPSISVCMHVYDSLQGKIYINGNFYMLSFTPNLQQNTTKESITYVTHLTDSNAFTTSMETIVHEDWFCEYVYI